MFGRKIKNTAAVAIEQQRPPLPQPVIHHHNQIEWQWIILVSPIPLGFVVLGSWWMLVSLIENLGSRQPAYHAAQCVVGGGLIAAIGVGVVLAGKIILNDFWQHRERLAEMVQETERLKLLQAQSSIDGMRMNSQDAPLAKLILAVMHDAYEYGPRGERGEIRWSRRMAKAVSDQHNLGLSERQCGQVSTWLLEHGVITNTDDINRARFDDLGSVKALVNRVFNVPVRIGELEQMS